MNQDDDVLQCDHDEQSTCSLCWPDDCIPSTLSSYDRGYFGRTSA